MNISKYIGKTFPAGKTAKELNLDTSRKFVVVEAGHQRFDVGTVLHFLACEESMCPIFVADDETKHARPIGLSYLAYLEEEDDEEVKKEYVPRVGDKVRLEGKISETHDLNFCTVEVQEKYGLVLKASSLTLISRAPRTLTKAEAEKLLSEKLGEDVVVE